MITIKRVRQAGVPLVVVETSDASQTQRSIVSELNGKAETSPLLHHDLASGLQAMNEKATELCDAIFGTGVDLTSMPPSEVLCRLGSDAAEKFLRNIGTASAPCPAFVIMHNPQLYWNNAPDVIQAIWNLRDALKRTGSQLLALVPPGTTLPNELKADAVVLTDTLPTREELAKIVESIIRAAALKPDLVKDKERIYDILSGLSAFAAEQVLAMSVTKQGVDLKVLWDRKRQTIEQTPGLDVWDGGETFADVGGYENVKTFLRRIMNGTNKPKAIVYEDEIDKAYGGLAGDSSGTTQDQLGVQLKFMQDHNSRGIIFFGVQGSGKSAIAKAVGNELGIPTIELDRGDMKDKLVGSSETRVRAALDVVQSISDGSALFIATCNKMAILPPELKRRFNYGTYFFDLPDRSARVAIWAIYLKKYPELFDMEQPKDEGWSGADIKTCALLAHDLQITLVEASEYIVPIGVSNAEQIETMRREAHRKYIDAGKPGVYEYKANAQNLIAVADGDRKFDLGE